MSKDVLFGYSVNLIRLSEEDGGGWLADVPELKGCLADGNDPQEALDNLKEVIETWIEVATEEGKEIPDPRIYVNDDYSGKFTLRVPKTLHRELANEADREGVSLNQYVLSLVAYNFGKKQSNNEIADQKSPQKGAHVLWEAWFEEGKKDFALIPEKEILYSQSPTILRDDLKLQIKER